jgi:SAM-dependent methyltransferase
MNADTRKQVLDNARYLRSVRPIDPDEIQEYVEGGAHPAVIRQVLREHAFELALRETSEGTFVPIDEGPISVAFHGVSRFPDEHAHRLEDALVREYGPGWPDGESGDALRRTIRRLKEDYFAQQDVEYDAETALAYAVYHLPDYYAAVQYVLAELAADGLLSGRLRVLEVGAGVGGPALGVHDFLPEDTHVEYDAVEPSAAADVFETMLADSRPSFRTTLHRETAEAFEPGEYDLVLFANVLSELTDPEAVARKYLDALAPDGSLVALAPADRNTAIGLRAVERALADRGPATVYAPEVRLWEDARPTDRGWSFTVEPDLEVPGFQHRLDRSGGGDGTYVNVDVQYAFSVLRLDGETAIEGRPSATRHARMAEMERHVTRRIDLVALKLSEDLSEGGNPLFRIGDGSQSVDNYAVLTRRTSLNGDLATAPYGSLLVFENVLALWNDDEGAYNLVVDAEAVVDVAEVPPGT